MSKLISQHKQMAMGDGANKPQSTPSPGISKFAKGGKTTKSGKKK